MDKKVLSFDDIESQAVMELPDREMMALISGVNVQLLNNVVVFLPVNAALNVCNIDINALVTNPTTGAQSCTAAANQGR